LSSIYSLSHPFSGARVPALNYFCLQHVEYYICHSPCREKNAISFRIVNTQERNNGVFDIYMVDTYYKLGEGLAVGRIVIDQLMSHLIKGIIIRVIKKYSVPDRANIICPCPRRLVGDQTVKPRHAPNLRKASNATICGMANRALQGPPCIQTWS
jgi:hypothetical protein